MLYMGSKFRLGKHIAPIVESYRKNGQPYVEPFLGGGNMMSHMTGSRYGYDIARYPIATLIAFRDGWIPPKTATKEQWLHVRANKDDYPDHLVGYYGHALSYCGIWFQSYIKQEYNLVTNGRPRTVRLHLSAYNAAIKQAVKLRGVHIACCSYLDIKFTQPSLIYCDPPYKNTSKYINTIDHDEFFQWCRDMSSEGHTVLVSEYHAPVDFSVVFEKKVSCTVNPTKTVKPVERLWLVP